MSRERNILRVYFRYSLSCSMHMSVCVQHESGFISAIYYTHTPRTVLYTITHKVFNCISNMKFCPWNTKQLLHFVSALAKIRRSISSVFF